MWKRVLPLTIPVPFGEEDDGVNTHTPTKSLEGEGKDEFDELLVAVKANNVDEVKRILDVEFAKGNTGIVNALDSHWKSALHYSGANGFTEISDLLLGRGARVRLVLDSVGHTPLTVAAHEGHLADVKLMIGKYKNHPDGAYSGAHCSVLHYAALGNHVPVAEYLLEQGANVNHLSEDGSSALHRCCMLGSTEVAEFLLINGIDHTIYNKDGLTALHQCCQFGFDDTVEVLLANGVDVNQLTRTSRYTPLHYAAMGGHTALTDLLIAKGAAVDLIPGNEGADKYTAPPVHLAACGSQYSFDSLQSLLAAGADPDLKDADGLTAIERVKKKRGLKDVVLLLQSPWTVPCRRLLGVLMGCDPAGQTLCPTDRADLRKRRRHEKLMNEDDYDITSVDRGYDYHTNDEFDVPVLGVHGVDTALSRIPQSEDVLWLCAVWLQKSERPKNKAASS